MGIPAATPVTVTPPANDKANLVYSSAQTGNAPFTGTGQTGAVEIFGPFNLVIYGSGGPNGAWNATIRLERSFDGGTTWVVCGVGGAGAQASWNTPNQDVSVVGAEPEKGVLYRLDCPTYTSGTINWRFSTSGAAAMSLNLGSVI